MFFEVPCYLGDIQEYRDRLEEWPWGFVFVINPKDSRSHIFKLDLAHSPTWRWKVDHLEIYVGLS